MEIMETSKNWWDILWTMATWFILAIAKPSLLRDLSTDQADYIELMINWSGIYLIDIE